MRSRRFPTSERLSPKTMSLVNVAGVALGEGLTVGEGEALGEGEAVGVGVCPKADAAPSRARARTAEAVREKMVRVIVV
jgi:hypothetical protein